MEGRADPEAEAEGAVPDPWPQPPPPPDPHGVAAPPPPPPPAPAPIPGWGAPGLVTAWGAPIPRPVPPAIGRATVPRAAVAAASGAAFLGLALVVGISGVRDLPPDLAGVPAARGPLLPVTALLTALATLATIVAGRRWLRAVVLATGRSTVRSLWARVEPSPDVFPRGLPAMARTVGLAVGLAIGGTVLAIAGVVARLAAPDRSVAIAASVVAFAGAVGILLAAGLLPVILRAVERREVDAARARGEGPLLVPGAWSPLPGLAVAAVVAAGLTAPLAIASPASGPCLLAAPWRCERVTVRADQLASDAFGDVVVVSYAVHPATDLDGRPPRTLVIATGGPGSSGIEDGEWMIDWLDVRITQRFDIVTFDARGAGGTDGRDCPRAAQSYYADDLDEASARAFAQACVDEAGAAGMDLGRFATDQVVEDIEAIRAAVGAERISLYGTSYGTVVGQAYGVAHPDRLDALVLDAPVDRSVPAAEGWVASARGFEAAIDATLAACREDVDCRAALPDARRTFLELRDRLERKGEIEVSIVGSDGRSRTRTFNVEDLADLTAGAMYSTTDRMSWLRALAGSAAGDDRPLVRLADGWSGSDGGSSFAYFATWCADARVVPADRPGDFKAFSDIVNQAGLEDLLAGDVAEALAPCVFWPGQAEAPLTRPVPVGVPTMILGTTGDPVTPIAGARSLLDQLPDARLIETDSGAHGSLGDDCPNARMAEFLVDGRLPVARTSTCRGWIVDAFVPLAVSPAVTADDAVEGMVWELLAAPEVLAWDGAETLRIGCAESGTAELKATGDGWETEVSLDGCAWAKQAVLSGSGTLDLATWDVTLEVSSARGELKLVATSATWRLSGTWDGRTVDETE